MNALFQRAKSSFCRQMSREILELPVCLHICPILIVLVWCGLGVLIADWSLIRFWVVSGFCIGGSLLMSTFIGIAMRFEFRAALCSSAKPLKGLRK